VKELTVVLLSGVVLLVFGKVAHELLAFEPVQVDSLHLLQL
jgi:hypothetical protein